MDPDRRICELLFQQLTFNILSIAFQPNSSSRPPSQSLEEKFSRKVKVFSTVLGLWAFKRLKSTSGKTGRPSPKIKADGVRWRIKQCVHLLDCITSIIRISRVLQFLSSEFQINHQRRRQLSSIDQPPSFSSANSYAHTLHAHALIADFPRLTARAVRSHSTASHGSTASAMTISVQAHPLEAHHEHEQDHRDYDHPPPHHSIRDEMLSESSERSHDNIAAGHVDRSRSRRRDANPGVAPSAAYNHGSQPPSTPTHTHTHARTQTQHDNTSQSCSPSVNSSPVIAEPIDADEKAALTLIDDDSDRLSPSHSPGSFTVLSSRELLLAYSRPSLYAIVAILAVALVTMLSGVTLTSLPSQLITNFGGRASENIAPSSSHFESIRYQQQQQPQFQYLNQQLAVDGSNIVVAQSVVDSDLSAVAAPSVSSDTDYSDSASEDSDSELPRVTVRAILRPSHDIDHDAVVRDTLIFVLGSEHQRTTTISNNETVNTATIMAEVVETVTDVTVEVEAETEDAIVHTEAAAEVEVESQSGGRIVVGSDGNSSRNRQRRLEREQQTSPQSDASHRAEAEAEAGPSEHEISAAVAPGLAVSSRAITEGGPIVSITQQAALALQLGTEADAVSTMNELAAAADTESMSREGGGGKGAVGDDVDEVEQGSGDVVEGGRRTMIVRRGRNGRRTYVRAISLRLDALAAALEQADDGGDDNDSNSVDSGTDAGAGAGAGTATTETAVTYNHDDSNGGRLQRDSDSSLSVESQLSSMPMPALTHSVRDRFRAVLTQLRSTVSRIASSRQLQRMKLRAVLTELKARFTVAKEAAAERTAAFLSRVAVELTKK